MAETSVHRPADAPRADVHALRDAKATRALRAHEALVARKAQNADVLRGISMGEHAALRDASTTEQQSVRRAERANARQIKAVPVRFEPAVQITALWCLFAAAGQNRHSRYTPAGFAGRKLTETRVLSRGTRRRTELCSKSVEERDRRGKAVRRWQCSALSVELAVKHTWSARSQPKSAASASRAA